MNAPAPEISIVVANWNGEAFLGECLATLWRSGEASGHPFELIVVDDQSSDGSVELIRTQFPQIRLIENPVNVHFSRTSNRGAGAAAGRIVVMMNNDMRVPEDFIGRLTEAFYEEPEPGAPPLFAVGAKTVDWSDGSPNYLCMDAAWRRGGLGQEWSEPGERAETTYPQGGSAAFDRELYLKLGGFDPIYDPYWQDFDLAWRAGKAGWRLYYEPRAVADHLGKASMTRAYGPNRCVRLTERSRFWFTWLNLQDRHLVARHIFATPWVLLRDLWRAGGLGVNGAAGFWMALAGLPKILRRRRERMKSDPPFTKTDREMLALRGRKMREGAGEAKRQ